MNFVYEEQLLESISCFIDAIDMGEVAGAGDLCKSLAMFFKEMLIERSKSIQGSKTPETNGKVDVDFFLYMIKTIAGSDDESIIEFIKRIKENTVSAETKYQFFDLFMYNACDTNRRNDKFNDQLIRETIKIIYNERDKIQFTHKSILNKLQKIDESSEDVEKKRNKNKASLLLGAFKKKKDIVFKEIKDMLIAHSFSDDVDSDIIIAKTTELLNGLSQMKESLNKIKSTYPEAEAKAEYLKNELITCEKLLNVDRVIRTINKEISIKNKEIIDLKLKLSKSEEINIGDIKEISRVVEESLNLVDCLIKTIDRECLNNIDESSQFFVVKKNFLDLEKRFMELQFEKKLITNVLQNFEIENNKISSKKPEINATVKQPNIETKKPNKSQNKKDRIIKILDNISKFLSKALILVAEINNLRLSFISAMNVFINPSLKSFLDIFLVAKTLTDALEKFIKSIQFTASKETGSIDSAKHAQRI